MPSAARAIRRWRRSGYALSAVLLFAAAHRGHALPLPLADVSPWRFRGAPGARPAVEAPGLNNPHGIYFTRAVYSENDRPRSSSTRLGWRTDYPKADQQLMIGVRRILGYADTYPAENPVRLDDARLGRFPFLYASEVGSMGLTEREARNLRHYLLAGGLLVVDDFWGSVEWEYFESEMRRVLPGHRIVELPLHHPLFHALYDIDEVIQVPNVAQGIRGGPTWEQDGYEARCRGIFDGKGRLMVVINWNTDLGDAWEWADHPQYPQRYKDYAYRLAVNFIVYATSH